LVPAVLDQFQQHQLVIPVLTVCLLLLLLLVVDKVGEIMAALGQDLLAAVAVVAASQAGQVPQDRVTMALVVAEAARAVVAEVARVAQDMLAAVVAEVQVALDDSSA
jgi:uncharacterized protein involved in cysteine biosynthesis